MSIKTLRRVASSFRNNSRQLVDAFLKRSDVPARPSTPFNRLEALEARQMLSAIPTWLNTFGSPVTGSDEFSSNNVNDIAIDVAGNTYITGTFRGTIDFDPSAAVNKLTASNENGDAFVAKFASDGTLTWARHLESVNSSDRSDARGITIDDAGNVYIIGSFSGSLTVDFGDGATNLKSAGDSDIFLAKISADSNLSGIKTIGGSGSDYVGTTVARQGGGGGFVVIGGSNQSLDLDPGVGQALVTPGTAGGVSFVAVYDFDLTLDGAIAVRNSTGFSNVSGAIVDDTANKVVLSFGFNGIGTVELGDKTLTDFNGVGAMVVQFDSSGESGLTLDWVQTFKSSDFVSPGPVVRDQSGNLYIGLNVAGSIDLDPGVGTKIVTSPTVSFSPTLLSLDSTGAFRWGHMIGSTEGEVRAIEVNSDGTEIFASGYFQGTGQFDPAGSSAGKRTATKPSGFIWSVSPTGKFFGAGGFYSAAAAGRTGYADVRAMAINVDDDVVLAGQFNGTVDFDASTSVRKATSVSTGISDDMFVLAIGSSGVADTGGTPAPSTDTFSQGKNLVVTDSAGNKVTLSLTGSGTGTITRTESGDINSVLIVGSKSTSSFSVTVSGTANGGTTTFGSISIGAEGDDTTDAIGAISAAKVNVAFGDIKVETSAASITLNGINDVGIIIGAAPTTGTVFKLGTVLNADIAVTGAIASIDATDWDTNMDGRGDISATSIGRVTSKGDFEANLALTGATKGNTLGNVTASGAVSNAHWNVTGNTGIINVGGFSDFSLMAKAVQGLTVGKLGVSSSMFTIQSTGAVSIGGAVNTMNLLLSGTGASGKLINTLTSLSATGAVNDLYVAGSAFANLGAFTFKAGMSEVQISGSSGTSAGSIGAITGTTAHDLTITGGTLGNVTFSGNADHVTIAAALKLGAVTFKGDLSEAVVNINATPAKAQNSLTSFTVGGNTTDLTVNSASVNNNAGAFTLTKTVDTVHLNITGDITSIKTGAATALHVSKAGKIGSVSIGGNLSGGTIDALAITGAFTVSGTATNNDITVNTSRAALQSATFIALGSLSIAGAVSGLNVSASGINSNFGAFTFKSALSDASFKTTANIAGITGTTGTNLNIDAGNLKALTFSGNITSLTTQAGAIGNFTTKGSLSDASFVIVSTAAKDVVVVGPFTVAGATSNISVLSAKATANFGALSLGTSVNNVLLNIAGDVASIKAGAVDKLDLTTPGTVGAFTVSGNFTNSNVDVLSLGNVTIGGNVNKVGLTVNTDLSPEQLVTFKALAGLTVTGTATNLTLTATGVNSNMGALTFNKGISNSIFDTRGVITSLTSKTAVDSFILTSSQTNTITITGGLTNSSITANNIGTATVNGNVNAFNLTLNPADSAPDNNKALNTLQINGTATALVISAPGFNSHVGTINITGASVGTQAYITGNATKIAALSFNSGTVISVSGKVTTLATGKSGNLDGSITATSFGAITVGGDLLAEIIGIGPAGIGAVNVTGNINGALLRTLGSITSITANAILNSTALSGYDNGIPLPVGIPVDAFGFINNTSSIGTVTVKATGTAASFVNSRIMGYKIGAVSLKVVQTSNSGTVFGFSAVTALGPVSRTGAATVSKITLPGQSVQVNDFVLRIVP